MLSSMSIEPHSFNSFLYMVGKSETGRTGPDSFASEGSLSTLAGQEGRHIYCQHVGLVPGMKGLYTMRFPAWRVGVAGFWLQPEQRTLKQGLDISIPTTSCTPKMSEE